MSIEVKKLKNVNDGKTYDIWTANGKPLYYLTENNIPVQVCPDNAEFCGKWPAVEAPAPEDLPKGFIKVGNYLRATILPNLDLPPVPGLEPGIEVYEFVDDDGSPDFNGDGLNPEGTDYVWRVLTGPEDNEDNEDNEDDEDDGLTGGQIAGIVLLALGGLGLLIFIIMLIVNSTKKKKKVKFNFMSFQDFIRNN